MFRLSAFLFALLLAAPAFAQDLPAGWSLGSLPDGATVENVSGGSTFLGARLTTAPRTGAQHIAGLFREGAYSTVEGRLERPTENGPGLQVAGNGTGIALYGESVQPGETASPDTVRYFVALFRRPDGQISLYARDRLSGRRGVLTPTRTDRYEWRLRKVGDTVFADEKDQFGAWVERGSIPTRTPEVSFDVIAAGAFALNASGFIGTSLPGASADDVDLPAGWSYSANPSGAVVSGTADDDGLDVSLSVATASGRESQVIAFQPGGRAVEGTLGDAVAMNASGRPGVGLVILNAIGAGDTDRTWVALVRRPDGEVVLRRRTMNGVSPLTSPDVVLPSSGLVDTDRWRLRLDGQRAFADQWDGNSWIPRGFINGNVAPTGAGVIAVDARGSVQDVILQSGIANAGVAPFEPVYVGYYPPTFDPATFAFGASLTGSSWLVRGPGDIWGRSDQFFGLAQQADEGFGVAIEGSILLDPSAYTWAKGGFMIRESLDPAAPYAFLMSRPNGEHYLQTRVTQGGLTSSSPVNVDLTSPVELVWNPGADRVEVIQSGQVIAAVEIRLGNAAYGLLVSSSTDIDGRGDALLTEIQGAAVRFPSPSSQACEMPPVALGEPTAVGGEISGLVTGRACFVAETGVLQVRGGGDIWGRNDQFEFVQQTVGTSDVVLSAERVIPDLNAPNTWDKNGLMIRGSLEDDAPFVFFFRRSGGGFYVQARSESGASVQSYDIPATFEAQAMRLEAAGSTVQAFVDGVSVFSTTFGRSEDDRAGFAVTSTNDDGSGTQPPTTGDFYAPSVEIDGATSSDWLAEYVLADPSAVQTGSATALDSDGGFKRFDVVAAGDIWGADDQFEFVHTTLAGDGVLTAEVESFQGVAPWAEPWAKAGPMMRQIVNGSLVDPQAAHASVFATLDRGIHFFAREAVGDQTFLFNSAVEDSTPGGPVRMRIERIGDQLISSVQLDGESGFTVFDETVFDAATGPAAVGFALTSTQSDFQSPGQVRATVGLRLTQTAGSTAQPWTETFDGMPRATSDGGATAWWGGKFAALTDDGALAIGGDADAATWRSEPLAASAGLDARLTIDTNGADASDRLRVLALVGDAEVEIAMLDGQSGTQIVAADGLRGSSVELRLVAQAPGGAFLVTEAALSPALPPVSDEPDAEAPVAALALSAPAPNPTRGDAWIELSARDAGTHRVEIVDLLGRRVASAETDARAGERVRVALPTASLGAGVYVVRATAPDGAQASQRMTVIR